MNAKRYALAGVVSVLTHSLILSVVPNKTVMAMPVGADSTTVSLNLVAAAQRPVAAPPVSANATPDAAPAKAVPQDTAVKKLVRQKKPEAKSASRPAVPKTSAKPAAKPSETVVPTIPSQPAVKSRPESMPAEETPPAQESDAVQETAVIHKSATSQQVSSGVNSKPQLVTKPTFATRPSPVKYPRMAKRRGLEGKVLVEVWIDASGKQLKHNLVRSSGADVLDQAALAAIKRWRFSSHIVDGQAIAHRVQIPVRFKLD